MGVLCQLRTAQPGKHKIHMECDMETLFRTQQGRKSFQTKVWVSTSLVRSSHHLMGPFQGIPVLFSLAFFPMFILFSPSFSSPPNCCNSDPFLTIGRHHHHAVCLSHHVVRRKGHGSQIGFFFLNSIYFSLSLTAYHASVHRPPAPRRCPPI